MNASSKNTKLINCLIALSTKNPDFPYPLFKKGFQLEAIEPRILMANGKSANPDIQFKRNPDLLAFFECKDGYCDKDQLTRYKSLTSNDISRAKVTSLSTNEFSIDLAYFCTKEKEGKLVPSVDYDGNPFPIIILDEEKIYRNEESNRFSDSQLNEIFNDIQFEGPVPENYIPFTVDDNDQIIEINLLQHFMTRFEYEFTLDDLLDDLFSHIIHSYSKKGRGNLKSRLANILKKLQNNSVFSGILEHSKKDGKYILKPRGPRSFKNACQKYVDKCQEELKGQATLSDFGEN